MTTGEKLDQILELLENKNFCCVRACKISDDFEIAFQLFQEYAESVGAQPVFSGFRTGIEIYSMQKCSSTVVRSSCTVQISQSVLRSFLSRKISGMLDETSLCKN